MKSTNDDAQSFKAIAKRKSKDNDEFYVFLKGIDMPDEEIDALVHDLYRKYAAEIDCQACRNCCKDAGPSLSREEIVPLARKKGMEPGAFIATYMQPSDLDPGTFEARAIPCPFLERNECSFGDDRPTCCKDYPFLLRDKFTHRLHGIFGNYELCPIVFNVIETLKHLVWNR